MKRYLALLFCLVFLIALSYGGEEGGTKTDTESAAAESEFYTPEEDLDGLKENGKVCRMC
ncbi:MAG: hypothetical protein ABJQ29_02960 [Luteolibacter sp.]